MKRLFAWRDEVAAEEDLALFRVAHGGALLSLSRKKFTEPQQLMAWAKNRYFRDHAKELISLLRAGREDGPIPFPARGKKLSGDWTAADEELFNKLRAWRNEESTKAGVEPSRIFSNRELKRMARSQAKNPESLSKLDGVESWKVEKYGEKILEVLKA